MSDKVWSYFKGNLPDDLVKLINSYTEFSGIDSFFNNSQSPAFFYEWSIQGMIYQLLITLLGGKVDKYMLLLEQPYTATNADLRTDIMYVNADSETIGGIEIKTNYNQGSAMGDMAKLRDQLTAGTIASGIGVYFVDSSGTAGRWLDGFEQDAGIKKAIKDKVLLPVPIVYEIE